MQSCEDVKANAAMTHLHFPLSSHGDKKESHQESTLLTHSFC